MAYYRNIIPVMTSSSQDGFATSATVNTIDARKVFDGKTTDTTSYYRSGISPTLPEYLTITFPKKYNVARYTIYMGYWNTQYTNMATWDLEGLVNGSWVVLHSGSNPTQASATFTFNITPTEVDGVRIKCKSKFGSNSWGFEELVVEEFVISKGVLLQSSDGEVKNIDYKPTTDLIPVMTAENASIARASSVYNTTSYQAWNAFNKVLTQTGSYNSWVTASGQLTGWLEYEFVKPTVVNKYTLIHGYNNVNVAPKTWTFKGSNDGGGTWTVLDSRTNITDWVLWTEKDFEFENIKSYKIYRIDITANNGHANYVGIQEIKMYDTNRHLKTIPTQTEQDFIDYGIKDFSLIDPLSEYEKKSYIMPKESILGSGELYKQQLDLNKYKVKKIYFE